MVAGVLTAAFAVLLMTALPTLPAAIDEAVEKTENDPKRTADEKQEAKEMGEEMKRTAEGPLFWVVFGLWAVAGAVMVLGGAQLMRLSGTTLPMLGSALALVPCTVGPCCLVGLPAGIWALIALNRPVVRSVIAANRAGPPPPNPDDQYLR
jgi:choline-glycine betaine transporter